MIDEKRLILSVKSGSEKAYRTLYEMWVSRLYQFVYQPSYLQPIITQYFIDNKSEIWLLFLIAHSKR